jgi:hypothetical protein
MPGFSDPLGMSVISVPETTIYELIQIVLKIVPVALISL